MSDMSRQYMGVSEKEVNYIRRYFEAHPYPGSNFKIIKKNDDKYNVEFVFQYDITPIIEFSKKICCCGTGDCNEAKGNDENTQML